MQEQTPYTVATLPPDESGRIQELIDYKILDTPPEQAFDNLTRIASTICDSRIALVTLIDQERQWFKSKHGLDVSETSRDISFCSHAILDKSLMIVEDALSDERFTHNPLVQDDPHIRFYAGAPLITNNGHHLSTLCVIDSEPRTLTDEQSSLLKILGDAVVDQLELRRIAIAHGQALSSSRTAMERHDGSLVTHIGRESSDFIEDIQTITEASSRTLGVARVSVWLFSDDRTKIECIDLYKESDQSHNDGLTLKIEDYPDYFQAIESGRYIAADDALTHSATRAFADSYLPQFNIASMLDSTIRIGGETIGVVCHEHVGKPRKWSPEETLFSGSIADAIGHALEVRQRKEILQEKEDLEQQYLHAQKLQSIGQLTSGIAHDFNNLLTPIIGYSQLCLKNKNGRVEYIQEIEKAGYRATALIRQIMGYSRSDDPNPTVCDLNEVVMNFSKMLERIIGEDVHMDILLTSDACYVHIDEGQIEQVIMNLVVNARDAMPHGGHLKISTRIQALENGQQVELSVKDAGAGIDPEVLPYVFDPFFTTKKKGRGTGLGLATCYDIVKKCSGDITVESQKDKGTIFRIALPLSKQQLNNSLEDDSAALLTGSETVLLLEDERPVNHLLKEILTINGYSVIDTTTITEARNCMLEQGAAIDLAVIDSVVPAMHEANIVDWLAENFPSIKILLITGYPESRLLELGTALDKRVLKKPFGPIDFLSAIRQLFDQQ